MRFVTLKELKLLIEFMENCDISLDTRLYIDDSRDGEAEQYPVTTVGLSKDKTKVIFF